MEERMVWASLSGAAEFIDVSTDTISRRAVEFLGDPKQIHLQACPDGKVRYKNLKLGEDTRRERRYYLSDLELWLV